MTEVATIPAPPGGLTLTIDRIVVRGAGAVSAGAVAVAIERAFADAFVTGERHDGLAVRRVRTTMPAALLADADGIAQAIRATVTTRADRR